MLFDYDGEVELGSFQIGFLEALRKRTRSWDQEEDTFVRIPGPDQLLLGLHLVDVEARASILTIGAVVGPEHVVADKLHNQLFELPTVPTELGLDVAGSPADLPDLTADWFEQILRRPLERREWGPEGRAEARVWLFTDNGQELVVSGRRERRLGPPDRITLVRGSAIPS